MEKIFIENMARQIRAETMQEETALCAIEVYAAQEETEQALKLLVLRMRLYHSLNFVHQIR